MDEQGQEHEHDEPTEVEGAPVPSDEQVRELEAENERLRAAVDTKRRRARVWRITRSVLTWVLVVLTSISVVATSTAFWVRNTVFDTDKYVALVTPIAQDPAVQQQIATKLTAQVFTALDVRARVEAILPTELQALAGPITSQVQSFIRGRVQNFVASDTFQQLWVQANTIAHEKIVALLEGNTDQLPNLNIANGQVQINLIGAVARVLQDLAQQLVDLVGVNVTVPDLKAESDPQAAIARLSAAIGRPLPPDFGQVTIMTVDQLEQLQTVTKRIQRLPWVLLILTFVLAAAAIASSLRRRRTLIALGIGAAVAFFLAIRLTDRMESNLVDAVTKAAGGGAGSGAAVRDLLGQVLAGIRAVGWWVIGVGLLVAIIAFLAGHANWFASLGRWWSNLVRRSSDGSSQLERWVARRADILRVAAIVIAAVLLFVWGISVLSIIVIGGLLALFLWGVAVAQQRVAGPADTDAGAGEPGAGEPGAVVPEPK
jgi:hypothetical protein